MRSRATTALALVLAALGACRAPSASPVPPPPAAERATHAPAARTPEAPAAPAAAPNRDPHGQQDVAAYIASLASPARVADLQIDLVVKELNLPQDAVVGDLGCGPGLFAVAFAQAVPEGCVLASDIEPAQLDALRARIASSKVRNVVPVLSSPDDPHFPPRRMDLVFVGDTYHHLRDRVAYMRRLADVFKPGGRLALLEYKPGKLPVGPPPEHKLDPGVMERELTAAGYTRVDAFGTHLYHDFEVWRVVQPWEKPAEKPAGGAR